MGALSNLWLGDKLGRRRTIVLGGIIMIIGAILQTSSFSYAQLVVARIITGIGNGLNVSNGLFVNSCKKIIAESIIEIDIYRPDLSCRMLSRSQTR